MDDITTEKKLELIHQIRSQHNKNQYDLSNREHILYGKTSYRTTVDREIVPEEIATSESLKFRSVLAGMLLVFAILFDYFGVQPGGMQMQQIFNMIAADYQENVSSFINTMSTENFLEP